MVRREQSERSEDRMNESQTEYAAETHSRLLDDSLQCTPDFPKRKPDEKDVSTDNAGGQTIHIKGPKPGDTRTETQWPDGTRRIEYEDGTGIVYRRSSDGGYTGTHYGWPPVEERETFLPDGTKKLEIKDILTVTSWPDRTEKLEFTDGGGFVRRTDGKTSVSIDSWGPD